MHEAKRLATVMKCVFQALGLQRCPLNFGGELDLPGRARDRVGCQWTRSTEGRRRDCNVADEQTCIIVVGTEISSDFHMA